MDGCSVNKPSILEMKKNCQQVAEVLKVLAHPQRLLILCFLFEERRTVGQLQDLCHISQSGVSQFLARMKELGILSCQREGSYVYYKIVDPKTLQLMVQLHQIYCPSIAPIANT